jgi:hypothetical protein
MMGFIRSNDALARAYGTLNRAKARNQGVVPTGVDPTLLLEGVEYSPADAWKNAVVAWTHERALVLMTTDRKGSTLQLLRRAVGPDDVEVPRFPLTKLANFGADQIRLRLLAGTSALNGTMCKWESRGRDSHCPFDDCDGVEDAIHLLTRCRGLDALREDYHARLQDRCTCDVRIGSGGEVGCAEFFSGLDDAGKALFMLGGPVDGRTPETSVDACAREFVRRAWESRSSLLDAKAERPLTLDLTRLQAPTGAGTSLITSFFTRTQHARNAWSAIGAPSERHNGSGLNGAIATGRN